MFFGNLNGPEYEARFVERVVLSPTRLPKYQYTRLKKPFSPPTVTLKDIHDAVPKDLMKS